MGFFGVEFCIRCYAIDMKPARFEFQTRLMHRFIALWLQCRRRCIICSCNIHYIVTRNFLPYTQCHKIAPWRKAQQEFREAEKRSGWTSLTKRYIYRIVTVLSFPSLSSRSTKLYLNTWKKARKMKWKLKSGDTRYTHSATYTQSLHYVWFSQNP